MPRPASRAKLCAVAVFLGLAAALPFLLRNEYYVGIAVFVGINAIVAIGLNLLMGYAGQVSLGMRPSWLSAPTLPPFSPPRPTVPRGLPWWQA